MGQYSYCLDKKLFIFALSNSCDIFLKTALLVSAFDKIIYRDEELIQKITEQFSNGARTTFVLNIFPLIDISVWKAKHFKGLIEIVVEFSENTYDKNNLMLTSNPIMSIALAADLLDTIGEKCKKLENECARIRNEILELGRLYTSKIDDE